MGNKYPSVTEILTSVGLIDTLFFNKEAGWRGSVVHKCMELGILDRLDIESVHPDLRGYIKSGLALWDSMEFQAVAIEQRMTHEELKFTGKPDVLAEDAKGAAWVLDWKSGKALPSAAYQTSGYEILSCESGTKPFYGKRVRRAAIELNKDGSMAKMKYFEDRNDKHVFLAALTIAHAKRRA